MAEPVSSRTAVRMAIGFMTSGSNEPSYREVVDEPTSTTSGARGAQPRQAGRPVGGTYSTSGRAADAVVLSVPAADEVTTAPPTTRRAQLTAPDPSAPRHDSTFRVGSRDCWPPEGTETSQEDVHRQPWRIGDYAPAHRWARFAWEPFAGAEDNGESSTAYSSESAGSGVPGIRGASAPQEHVHYTHQEFRQLGVKRFRASDGSCSTDEQGGEEKRVGSPYRLIRRTPASQGVTPPAYSRQLAMPRPRSAGFAAGATEIRRESGPASSYPFPWEWTEDYTVASGPSVGRVWPQETASVHATGHARRSWVDEAVTNPTGQEGPLPRLAEMPVVAAYEPTTSRLHRGQNHDRTSGTRTRYDSLKVQRLGVGHVDTLTNGVNRLGVASSEGGATSAYFATSAAAAIVIAGAAGAGAGAGGAGGAANVGNLDDDTLTRGRVRQQETLIGSLDHTSYSAETHRKPAVDVSRIGTKGPRVQESWGTGYCEGQSNVEGYRTAELQGHMERLSSTRGPAFRTAVGGKSDAISSTSTPNFNFTSAAPPSPPRLPSSPLVQESHPDGDSKLRAGSLQRQDTGASSGATSRTQGCRVMDVEGVERDGSCPAASSSAHVLRSASSLGKFLPGSEDAPGYDAAISAAGWRSGDAGVDEGKGAAAPAEVGPVPTATVDGGDVDDDSSDGGAAHEEISAWLHSTADWWTS